MGLLIAEVKTVSPFGWRSRWPREYLLDLALEHGDWISIHTEKRWGGSVEALAEVRRRMIRHGIDKPLLAKGVHGSDSDLRRVLSVADYALVVGRWPRTLPPELQARVIFEPTFEGQVRLAIRAFVAVDARPRIVLNRRNLDTGDLSTDTPSPGVVKAMYRGNDPWVVHASFIASDADLDAAADAHLVGSSLVEFLEARGLGYQEG